MQGRPHPEVFEARSPLGLGQDDDAQVERITWPPVAQEWPEQLQKQSAALNYAHEKTGNYASGQEQGHRDSAQLPKRDRVAPCPRRVAAHSAHADSGSRDVEWAAAAAQQLTLPPARGPGCPQKPRLSRVTEQRRPEGRRARVCQCGGHLPDDPQYSKTLAFAESPPRPRYGICHRQQRSRWTPHQQLRFVLSTSTD